MSKYYTISELSKITLVSARTLHYYDEINLLKPDFLSEKGHRRYSENNLLHLQQIITLKHMGFSLIHIRKILHGDGFDILASLKIQAQAIAEEEIRIKKIKDLFNYLIKEYEVHNNLDWKNIENIISTLNLKSTHGNRWYDLYLSQDDLQEFNQFKRSHYQKWLALFNEIKRNLDKDPLSKEGLALVKKWDDLANNYYRNHPKLRTRLWEIYKAGMIPESYFPYDKEVIEFISIAERYLNENNE